MDYMYREGEVSSIIVVDFADEDKLDLIGLV